MGTSVDPEFAPLLRCSESDFDKAINGMKMKELIETVSNLQKEMKSEQEKFNLLTEEIGEITDHSSAAYVEVSHELVKVQNKLAMLMKRNMKCFNQQNSKSKQSMAASPATDNHGCNGVSETQTEINSHSSQASSVSKSQIMSRPPPEEFVIEKENVLTPYALAMLSKPENNPTSKTVDINVKKSSSAVPIFKQGSDVKVKENSDSHCTRRNNNVLVQDKVAPSGANSLSVQEKALAEEESVTLLNELIVVDQSKNEKKTCSNTRGKSRTRPSILAQAEVGGAQSFLTEETVDMNRLETGFGKFSDDFPVAVMPTIELAKRDAEPAGGQLGSDASLPDSVDGGCLNKMSHTALMSTEDLPIRPVELDLKGEETVPDKVTLQDWDPESLLKKLYELKLVNHSNAEEVQHKYLSMEGYAEMLPEGKSKDTLLKTWRRKYFRINGGKLFYYDRKPVDVKVDKAAGFFQLMGANIDKLGNRMIGINDGRGHYMMLRIKTDEEYRDWQLSLTTQTYDFPEATYIQPMLQAPKHPSKKVVVVDLGSTSIRAGILGAQPSLPTLFFPAVVATEKTKKGKSPSPGSTHIWGFEAFKPATRKKYTLSRPIMPTITVEKFNIDLSSMPSLFKKIFKDLGVSASSHWVILSTPQKFSIRIKAQLMKLLIEEMSCLGVSMVPQAMLALYSYNATSGIVIDVGERLEVLPVTDGYVVQAGVSKQAYGGQRVLETLNATLVQYRLFSDIDKLIIRYCMEKANYVSANYDTEVSKFFSDTSGCDKKVDVRKYDVPLKGPQTLTVSTGRFKSPEGLFNKAVWGVDDPGLAKLVIHAANACPMDTRRMLYRSIFLSGGVTMTKGFAERLNNDLKALVPSSLVIQVHTHPYRYHAAYIGACCLANLRIFEQIAISANEWKTKKDSSLQKWQNYFEG